MRFGPHVLSDWILSNVPLDASPKNIDDLLAELINQLEPSMGALSAREKAESWSKKVISRLRIEIGQLLQMGRACRVTFNSSSEYMIQGACFVEPTDTQELRDAKSRRLRSSDYVEPLKRISPSQFEQLCGHVIQLLGVDKPTITRRSADEGIDFFGRLKLSSIFYPHDLTPTIQNQLSIWIVGQAKHYPAAQSGTPMIRDLVGAITLGRSKAFGSIEAPFRDLDIRPADPVFALFVTTGTLSSNAWRLLERSGVIGVDGEMLAAFLADRQVGIGPSGFDIVEFRRWLAS